MQTESSTVYHKLPMVMNYQQCPDVEYLKQHREQASAFRACAHSCSQWQVPDVLGQRAWDHNNCPKRSQELKEEMKTKRYAPTEALAVPTSTQLAHGITSHPRRI